MRTLGLRPQFAAAAFALPFAATSFFQIAWREAPRSEAKTQAGADLRLLEAYSLMRSTVVGAGLAETLASKDILIESTASSRPSDSSWADYAGDRRGGKIRLQPELLQGDNRLFLAGVLAHELTHARQHLRALPDALDNEFEARVNEALVLRELSARAPPADPRVWRMLLTFERGRASFEAAVERDYPGRSWLDRRKFGTAPWGNYYWTLERKYASLWKGKERVDQEGPDLRELLREELDGSLHDLIREG